MKLIKRTCTMAAQILHTNTLFPKKTNRKGRGKYSIICCLGFHKNQNSMTSKWNILYIYIYIYIYIFFFFKFLFQFQRFLLFLSKETEQQPILYSLENPVEAVWMFWVPYFSMNRNNLHQFRNISALFSTSGREVFKS